MIRFQIATPTMTTQPDDCQASKPDLQGDYRHVKELPNQLRQQFEGISSSFDWTFDQKNEIPLLKKN